MESSLRVFPENTPSLNLLRKHGFREAGKLLRHASLDGVWRDVVIVEDFLDQRRKMYDSYLVARGG